MRKNQAMLTIDHIKSVITDYFEDKPVKKVYLFGSYAKGVANENSDTDLLFSLADDTQISYFGLAAYLGDLEDRLSKKVDLVENGYVYPRIKKFIDAEKILLLSK
jgi:predicted nucleotidyltransferase